MSFDGNNFNGLVEDTLKERMYRLLRDADPLSIADATLSLYIRALEQLLRYPPLRAHLAVPWHVVVVTLAAVRERLAEVARPYRRESVDERGDYPEFFELQEKLDDEENEWRASLNLLPVNYEDV